MAAVTPPVVVPPPALDPARLVECFPPHRWEGHVRGDRRVITGGWTFSCGPDCTCGGSTGSFTLKRID